MPVISDATIDEACRPGPGPDGQANRLFETARAALDAEALSTLDAPDTLASRVFPAGGATAP